MGTFPFLNAISLTLFTYLQPVKEIFYTILYSYRKKLTFLLKVIYFPFLLNLLKEEFKMDNETYYMVTLTSNIRNDAFDIRVSKVNGDDVTSAYSSFRHYTPDLQADMQKLKRDSKNQTYHEMLSSYFFQETHDKYIRQAAKCIDELCTDIQLKRENICAVLFSGEKFECNYGRRDRNGRDTPYTVELGSGQMLADLTGVKVVYGLSQEKTSSLDSKHSIPFFSILGNLFNSKKKNQSEIENISNLLETKVATPCVYRSKNYESNKYEYDDKLSREQVSLQEKETIARYCTWSFNYFQGRFGR